MRLTNRNRSIRCARGRRSRSLRRRAPRSRSTTGAERPGTRQLEIAIRDLNVRQERRSVVEASIWRSMAEAPGPRLGGSRRYCGRCSVETLRWSYRCWREHEHRDSRHVRPGVGAHQGAAVAGESSQASPARGCRLSRSSGIPAVGRETGGIVQVRREERVGRIDEDLRVPGPLPAQAEVQRQRDRAGMPGVLHECSQLVGLEVAGRPS